MALPAVLISGLAKAATNRAVQAAAIKLAQDVYGRVLPSRKEEPKDTANPNAALQAKLETLASKEEIAAAFALLQAEVDRRHRRTVWVLLGVAALQLLTIAAMMAR